MGIIGWSPRKNNEVKKKHGFSFEEVFEAIENGFVLDVYKNTNPLYKGEYLMDINLKGKLVLVPFMREKGKIILKSAYQDKKLKKKYGGL